MKLTTTIALLAATLTCASGCVIEPDDEAVVGDALELADLDPTSLLPTGCRFDFHVPVDELPRGAVDEGLPELPEPAAPGAWHDTADERAYHADLDAVSDDPTVVDPDLPIDQCLEPGTFCEHGTTFCVAFEGGNRCLPVDCD